MDTNKKLQVRGVSVEVLDKAEQKAVSEGFNSVQDVVRLLLKRYADDKLNIFTTDEWVIPQKLIDEYKKEHQQLRKDLKSGKKKSYSISQINDLMSDLLGEEDSLHQQISNKSQKVSKN